MDIVQELEESAGGWDDCGSEYADNADMERRAAAEITQLREQVEVMRVALRECVAIVSNQRDGLMHVKPAFYEVERVATQALAKVKGVGDE